MEENILSEGFAFANMMVSAIAAIGVYFTPAALWAKIIAILLALATMVVWATITFYLVTKEE